MMNSHPTPKQEKEWLERVTEYGCVITGRSDIDRHHCVGREGKQNKLYVGRWFVLPLAKHLHERGGPDPLNITEHRKAFVAEHGPECELFQAMCQKLENDGPLPFGDDVMQAIMDTRR